MKRKRLWLPILLGLPILAGLPLWLTAQGFPVYDNLNNINRILEHGMTMVKLALQIEQLQLYRQQFDDFDRYRRWIDGEFQKVRTRLVGQWTQAVQNGNLDLMPSGSAPPFSGTAPARDLENAIQSLRSVMNGTDANGFAGVGPAVRALVGVSPETVVGARTKAASREIESHIAWVNRINAAVAEKRANIEYLRNRVNSGALTPGDLQRELTILATEQADLQTLQIQAQNAATRVALQQLSLQAGDTNGREVERIQDSRDRLNIMQGAMSFTLAPPPAR